MSYNGWTNKSTWAVKLHWDNNMNDTKLMFELTKEYEEKGLAAFGDALQNEYEEIFECVIGGNATEEAKNMVRDVGNGHDVDWAEIARAYRTEMK